MQIVHSLKRKLRLCFGSWISRRMPMYPGKARSQGNETKSLVSSLHYPIISSFVICIPSINPIINASSKQSPKESATGYATEVIHKPSNRVPVPSHCLIDIHSLISPEVYQVKTERISIDKNLSSRNTSPLKIYLLPLLLSRVGN